MLNRDLVIRSQHHLLAHAQEIPDRCEARHSRRRPLAYRPTEARLEPGRAFDPRRPPERDGEPVRDGQRPLSLAMLFRVARVLDVDAGELLGLTPKNARFTPEEVEVISYWRVLDGRVRRPVLELLRIGSGAVRRPAHGATLKKP